MFLEFSWESFAFAIVNFLILVGLLAKFLHKPLRKVLDARREDLEKSRSEAEEARKGAERERQKYERKVAEAEAERHRLLAEAREKAEEDYRRILEKARTEAEAEAEAQRRSLEQQEREALSAFRQRILAAGIETADCVLRKTTGQDVNARLGEQLLAELTSLSDSGNGGEAARHDETVPVLVCSAKEIDGPFREKLEAAIGACVRPGTRIEFRTDETLVAGVRVEFSARAVDATLADVLERIRREAATVAGEGESGVKEETV